MNFSKMHGLGNDFILLEEKEIMGQDYAVLARTLCDRHTGIGANGILIIQASQIADLRMRIFNCDGSEAEMCGNGIRCFARYAFEHGWVTKHEFSVETLAGIVQPQLILKNNRIDSIKINMGQPRWQRKDIPMLGAEEEAIDEVISVLGKEYRITSLFMGVPHTIVFVDDVKKVQIDKIGPAIEKHKLFPKGTNVNFVEVKNEKEIYVRTWERGAGMTLACGTGCCASVAAAWKNKLTENKVLVHLPLGDLSIEYAENGTVYMAGAAEYSFSGKWNG